MNVSPIQLDELLRNATYSREDILAIVQEAIVRGQIVMPDYQATQSVYAGGTNFCPNSDFAWSHMAATTSGILPATAGDTNYEAYRVFRQQVGSNIGSSRVRASGHSLYAANEAVNTYLPSWDRVNGRIDLGWDGGAGSNYDIAIQLVQTWPHNSRKRYIRLAIATDTDVAVPTGVKLYAGLWIIRSGGTQEWATGNGFTLTTRKHYIPGSRQLEYMVVAKTDSGSSLESAVTSITDAPASYDADNYLEITYPAAAGFIEFFVYRKDVTSGQVDLIAHDRNSSQLVAYDIGQSIRVEPSGFPTGDYADFRSYAEATLDVFPVSQQMTFHSLTLLVPAELDTDGISSVYLRMGLTGAVDHNRQITIDTVWEGDTYNIWSPSPFDNYPSVRSTTFATAPPTGGGGGTGPPGGGSGGGDCLSDLEQVETVHGWRNIGDVEGGERMPNGTGLSRVVSVNRAFSTQLFEVEFETGQVVRATAMHKWGRSLYDDSGVLTVALNVGDKVWGFDGKSEREIEVIRKALVPMEVELPISSVKLFGNSKLYRVGSADRYVYSHNSKPIDI